MDSDAPPKKKQHCRRYCPHCCKSLSYSAYWSHKAKYYSCETDTWLIMKQNEVEEAMDDDGCEEIEMIDQPTEGSYCVDQESLSEDESCDSY